MPRRIRSRIARWIHRAINVGWRIEGARVRCRDGAVTERGRLIRHCTEVDMRWLLVLLAMVFRVANAQTGMQTPAGAMAAIVKADSEWLGAMRRHDVSRIVAPYDTNAV